MMKIELIFHEGCLCRGGPLKNLYEVMTEEKVEWEVIQIDTNEMDSPLQTRGKASPTILINGQDISPIDSCGGACRIYTDLAGSLSGVPSKELIRHAIRKAKNVDLDKEF